MSELDVVAAWNKKGKAYASIDRNPNGQNKIIIAKGNNTVIKQLTRPITNLYLDDIWDSHRNGG